MRGVRNNGSKGGATLTLTLPRPHRQQGAFLRSEAKRKVIAAGRRGGKTTAMAIYASLQAIRGRRVLEAAPTFDQTDAFWTSVVSFFGEAISSSSALTLC